jgi:hypothetical protein
MSPKLTHFPEYIVMWSLLLLSLAAIKEAVGLLKRPKTNIPLPIQKFYNGVGIFVSALCIAYCASRIFTLNKDIALSGSNPMHFVWNGLKKNYEKNPEESARTSAWILIGITTLGITLAETKRIKAKITANSPNSPDSETKNMLVKRYNAFHTGAIVGAIVAIYHAIIWVGIMIDGKSNL